MRFDFDEEKSRTVKLKHGVKKTSKPPAKPTDPAADQIAEMASRGENVSSYFTNKFTVVRPIRRVNVDLTEGLLRAFDERAARLNISSQAVIKTLLEQALVQDANQKRRGRNTG